MKDMPGYFEISRTLIFLVASLAGGVLFCWPILLNGGPLLFFDTVAYLSGGEKIFSYAIDAIFPAETIGNGHTDVDTNKVGRSIRSVFYSLFVFVFSGSFLKYSGPVLIQSVVLASLMLCLLPEQSRVLKIPAFIGLLTLVFVTPLPFYASLLMPDIMAAILFLSGLIIARGSGIRASLLAMIGLTAAIASHYGHLPLAAVLMALVLIRLIVIRRINVWRMCAVFFPFIFASAINVVAGAVAFDSPSVAPRRLPILLARSIEDGPALWHLRDHCIEYNYAICAALPEMPENVGAFLWQKDGIRAIKSADVISRIREEERIILQRAFFEYPVQQTRSLLSNFTLQFFRFGLSDVYLGEIVDAPDGSIKVSLDKDAGRRAFDTMERIHIFIVIIAAIYLFYRTIWSKNGISKDDIFMIWFLAIALLVNAAIFGGLSAPVDRYQGRIIWLVPFVAILLWIRCDDQ